MLETMDHIEHGSLLSSEIGIVFKAIHTDIKATVEVILNIAAAMDQQTAGAADILTSIDMLVDLTGNIKKITPKDFFHPSIKLNLYPLRYRTPLTNRESMEMNYYRQWICFRMYHCAIKTALIF